MFNLENPNTSYHFSRDQAKSTEICKKVDGLIRCVKATENIEKFASLLGSEDSTKRSIVACSLLNYFVSLKDVPDALLDIVSIYASQPPS